MDIDGFYNDIVTAEKEARGTREGGDAASRLYNTYQMLEELGHGAYGTVTKAKHKFKRGLYAIKHIDKKRAGAKGLSEVKSEFETMSLLNHPYIVHLEEVFQDDYNMWIVMEYVPGGELQKALKRVRRFEEPAVRRMAVNLLLAVDYIHGKGIVHRDLKPANCLLSEERHLQLKIADFGFAVLVGTHTCLTSFCGTTVYMAPEILIDLPYGKPVDMWAVGVLLFVLFSGDYPFVGHDEKILVENITTCHYTFNDNPIWETASVGMRDLVEKLLLLDPSKRLTAAQALKHFWVKAAMEAEFDMFEIQPGANFDGATSVQSRRRRTPRLLLRGCTYAIIAAHRLVYAMRCIALKREGADFPILRSYSFLVGRHYDPPHQSILASAMCYGNAKAIDYLICMLEASGTVDMFDISSNGIDSLELIQHLVRVATNHASLTVLNLENNPIPPLAGRSLLRLARNAARLKVINVNGTTLGSEVISQIAACLKELEKKRADGSLMSPATSLVSPSCPSRSPMVQPRGGSRGPNSAARPTQSTFLTAKRLPVGRSSPQTSPQLANLVVVPLPPAMDSTKPRRK